MSLTKRLPLKKTVFGFGSSGYRFFNGGFIIRNNYVFLEFTQTQANTCSSSRQSAIHQDVHTSQSSRQSAIHQDVHTSQSCVPHKVRVLSAAAVKAACGVWCDYRFSLPNSAFFLAFAAAAPRSSARCHFYQQLREVRMRTRPLQTLGLYAGAPLSVRVKSIPLL